MIEYKIEFFHNTFSIYSNKCAPQKISMLWNLNSCSLVWPWQNRDWRAKASLTRIQVPQHGFLVWAQLLVSRKFQNIEFYRSTLSGSRDNSLGTLNAEDCRCVMNCDHCHLYCKTHSFGLRLVFTQDRQITKYYWCRSATTKKLRTSLQ